MAIKFEYDKDGNLIAVNDAGEKVGGVATMGDLIEEETEKNND